MDKFSINSSTKFTVIKELNSEFTLVKIKVMATGKNRNMSYFDKSVVENHLNSLNYAPVIAHLFKNEDGEYRIGGHDMYIDIEDWSIKSLCVPFGVVKADTFEWETINEYGTDVDYLTCEAVLWTGRYPELKETIYSEDVWWNQSMEIDCKEYRPLEEDSNYIEVLDFEFSALCLLYKSDNRDENVTPCFISADVTPINFSSDDFVTKMNEMKQAMSEVFAFGDKEGGNVDENKVNENNTQEDPETFSNEVSALNAEAEPTYAISQFQLTANEKWEKINSAIRGMGVVTNDSDTWYYLEDYDDNYAFIERHIYFYANDTHKKQYGRVAYSIVNNEVSVNSEFEEMRVMWLTLEEANNVEEARNNYTAVKAEVEILRPYKLAVEKAEREKAENEIFAKYDGQIGEMPEYKTLKEKSGEYSCSC